MYTWKPLFISYTEALLSAYICCTTCSTRCTKCYTPTRPRTLIGSRKFTFKTHDKGKLSVQARIWYWVGWSTQCKKILIITTAKLTKLQSVMLSILPTSHQCFTWRWHLLPVILLIILPATIDNRGMFTRLKHDLTNTNGKCIPLSDAVHDDISMWRQLIDRTDEMPTHL